MDKKRHLRKYWVDKNTSKPCPLLQHLCGHWELLTTPCSLQIADLQGSKLHRRVNSKRIECVESPHPPMLIHSTGHFWPYLKRHMAVPASCSHLVICKFVNDISPQCSVPLFSFLLCMYRGGRSGCEFSMCAYREERKDRCESSLGIVVRSGLGDVRRLSACWSEGRGTEEGRQEGWRKKADLKDTMKNKVPFCSKSSINGW